MTHLDDAKHIIELLEAHGFEIIDYGVSDKQRYEDEFSLDLTLGTAERDDDSPTSNRRS